MKVKTDQYAHFLGQDLMNVCPRAPIVEERVHHKNQFQDRGQFDQSGEDTMDAERLASMKPECAVWSRD